VFLRDVDSSRISQRPYLLFEEGFYTVFEFDLVLPDLDVAGHIGLYMYKLYKVKAEKGGQEKNGVVLYHGLA